MIKVINNVLFFGQQKMWKVVESLNIPVENSPIIGYERGVFERFGCSQARMELGFTTLSTV